MTASPVHIFGFAGSLRQSSTNRSLLRAAGELLPEGATLEIFDLAPIPLYNPDIEAAGDPEPVRDFKERIRAADALLIVTPEYNYSVSGVLKNALDWASRPARAMATAGKPVAIAGAGGRFGAVRAQHHLRQIAVEMQMLPLAKPELHVIRAREHFDEAGRLVNETTRQELSVLLTALADWTRRLRGG